MNLQNLGRGMKPILSVLFIMIWLSNLAGTDAYFIVYTLVAFLSFFLNLREDCTKMLDCNGNGLISFVLSIVFSFLVLLANYPIFTQIGDPALIGRSTSIIVNVINGILSFIGGVFVANPIFSFLLTRYPLACAKRYVQGMKLPVFIFASIFILHFIHLILVEFPGNLTQDSFTQISEMISGSYSNFNTFWHTIFFQGLLSLGYSLFSDVNSAVSVFVIFQLIFMVLAFSYCLMTMLEYGVPKLVVGFCWLLFAIMPYHMALSITVWKDVLFAGASLLILSSWLRISQNLGRFSSVNYIVFILASLFFFISRANGWLIYLVTFLVYFIFIRGNKRFLFVMGVLSAVGWFMLNPALSILGVTGGDLVESLSIPIQQVSRVIVDDKALTGEEEELLSYIVDLEEVPDLYVSWLSDPMKVEVRSKDYAYFQAHFSEYVSLWIKLGLKYPWEYLKAWVDQTKGYWNAGYDYAMYSETITDNPYGIEKTGGNNPIASLFRLYFGLSRHVIFFEPLHSIGLHVWIFLICLIVNIRQKRELWTISVPLLLLLIGMWFGTPVYCCFRYVYPLFVSMPLIVSTTVWQPRE